MEVDIKKLVTDYRNVKEELDENSKREKELKKKELAIRYQISDYLTAKQAKSSEKYEGIGFVNLNAPKLKPTISTTDEGLLDWLRAIDCGDLIKESIHYSTLSAQIKKVLEEGEIELPEFVTYTFEPSLTLYKR